MHHVYITHTYTYIHMYVSCKHDACVYITHTRQDNTRSLFIFVGEKIPPRLEVPQTNNYA